MKPISFAYSLKVDFNSGFNMKRKRFWPTVEPYGVLIIGEGYVQWISNEWYKDVEL